ncbi:MAG: hypothetical protein A2V65_07450 [Deltaproteobacteria bacterium RBG_13_49_15]|nr:MAG: hypothetical protein A2V65_07450 [Deltaproteobacteria bacterium RBG_13_49_15]
MEVYLFFSLYHLLFVKSRPAKSHFLQMTPFIPLPLALFFSLFFSLTVSFSFLTLFPSKWKFLSNTKSAFISEKKCEEFLYPLIPDIAIEETRIPFGCVAMDIVKAVRVL